MIKVGILPVAKLFLEDDPYKDKYTFDNVYTKRIFEMGAIPVGILLSDGKLDMRSLEMCDAFFLGGGKKIEPYFFDAIYYAITHNKPVLGICLGMQTIGVYSYLETLIKEKNETLTLKHIHQMYDEIRREKINFLLPVEGHHQISTTRENHLENMHKVTILKDSKLYQIYQKEEMEAPSMHKYQLHKYGDGILINCMHGNVIEGLEYKDPNLFILGVQWHPELEEENNILFASLIEEAKRRKNELCAIGE